MKNILWELVVPELWENDESGLILANKEDVRNGVIPLLVGGWSSGSDMCPPKGWIPYSDVLGGRSIDWDEDEDTVLFLDEIHIVDQAGNQKLILVPPGLSTHFYACGVGIYRNSEKVVFLNVSPHTWCGIKNVSLATVDLHSFSITLQPFDEPDFICSYLERLTGCTSEDPSSEIYSWSNGEVEICLCEHGDKLLIAAESPAVTLEMNWNAGRWKINGHKNGRCVPQNEAFYLQDINGRP
jgi:hypothetical protein